MRKIIFVLLLAVWISLLSGCGLTLYSRAENACKKYVGENALVPYKELYEPRISCKEGIATVCAAYASKMKFGEAVVITFDKRSYICLVSDKNGTIIDMYDAGFTLPAGNYIDAECPESVRVFH